MTAPHIYRAAGWVSRTRESGVRLTSPEEAGLSDAELIALATERGANVLRIGGSIEVGDWSPVAMYVLMPTFAGGPVPTAFDDAAENSLQFALRHPFDRQQAIDLAHWAAQGVISNLCDRGGLDDVFGNLDEELRSEVVGTIAAIVRRVLRSAEGRPAAGAE